AHSIRCLEHRHLGVGRGLGDTPRRRQPGDAPTDHDDTHLFIIPNGSTCPDAHLLASRRRIGARRKRFTRWRVRRRRQDEVVTADLRLGVGLTLLLAIALAVLTVAGVRQRRGVLVAAIRASVQLALIAAALRGVFAAPATSIAVVAVMFTVATGTAAR